MIRFCDIVLSCLGLLLLSPLFAVVAVWIVIDNPGPIFYRQMRVGKDGKLFTIRKFRTMTANHGGSSVSVAGESRITSLGAKLRHYKLDELPELWNVLKGDMSFVGPRPDVPGYADQLKGEDREVLKLRPGITGPATLKYRDEEDLLARVVKEGIDGYTDPVKYNDEVIFPDKVRLNRFYMNHYSFWSDIKMLFATVLGCRIDYAGERI